MNDITIPIPECKHTMKPGEARVVVLTGLPLVLRCSFCELDELREKCARYEAALQEIAAAAPAATGASRRAREALDHRPGNSDGQT